MSAALFILDEELHLLVARSLKPIPSLLEPLEWFIKDPKKEPILQNNGYNYIYIQRDDLLFVSMNYGTINVNPMTTFAYLVQLHQLFQKYLGQQLNKVLVCDNINVIHELIDESIDMGIPQLTDYNIIRDYIKVKVVMKSPDSDDDDPSASKKEKGVIKKTGSKKENDSKASDENYINSFIAKTMTSAISWRPKGIHYNKNEFFLDVIEQQEYLVDFDREQVRSNAIHGSIKCRSYLSGMPSLTVGFNDIITRLNSSNQIRYHQCVDLNYLASDGQIRFIPPDGEFQLCSYKLPRPVAELPMISLDAFNVKLKPSKKPDGIDRLVLSVTISTNFKRQDSTSFLNIKVPLTKIFSQWEVDLSFQPRFKCDKGNVMFNITDDYILWELGKIKGGKENSRLTMQSEFHLYYHQRYEKLNQDLSQSMDPPPARCGPHLEELYQQTHDNPQQISKSTLLKIDFEVPYYTLSGLKVQFLKIDEQQLNFQSFPWIRSKTVNHEVYAYQL
ncbi:HHR171Wp [Eremothecium sinecaudum]|uniref:HHR171Wp n=1 Tax=Eremothecium sinecaudum TaxID=45286 RepID=A0A0X8HWY3_9SACH|nr:HHR171Wp [Eremothecium sinecaudum]AMD22940.1 HHR171Wp [Eremothecium sinecaudum]